MIALKQNPWKENQMVFKKKEKKEERLGWISKGQSRKSGNGKTRIPRKNLEQH